MQSWAEKEKEYVAQGFTSEQINEYKQRKYNEYIEGGVDPVAVNSYFGIKEPDEAVLADKFKSHLEGYQPQEADTILEAIDAGWQVSSTALLSKAYKGQNINPDTVVPDHAPTYMKVAQGLATVTGDVPAMVAGYIGGKAAGAVVGGVIGSKIPAIGTAAGATIGGEFGAQVGANAAPEFIRTALIEYYNRGEMKTAAEFTDFASTVFLKTAKAGAVGALTHGAGKYVAGKWVAAGASQGVANVARTSSEIVTMTTVGKALEGELPNMEDFTTSAAIIGTIGTIGAGINYSPKAVRKLQEIYIKTGKKPADVVAEAATDPVLRQEILSENDAVPKYGIEQKQVEIVQPETVELYHGTSTKFDELDYERGGGMVHFAEKEADAMKYAEDIGSGGRKRLNYDEIVIRDYSGKQFYFKQTGEETYKLPSGKEIKTPVGEWVSSDGEVISMKDVEKGTAPMSGDLVASAKNARIIKSSIDKSKILDTYPVSRWEGRTKVRNNPEGLKKIIEIIKPKDKFQQRLVDAAKEELEQTGTNTFGSEFWSLTKNARLEEVNASMKDFSKQLSDAGYEAIRFADDSHSTVAVFDHKLRQAKVEPTQQSPNLARIGKQPDAPTSGMSAMKLYTYVVDKLYPIKVELKNLGSGSKAEDVYRLFRMIPDYKAKVKHIIEKGTLNFADLSNSGEGVLSIFNDFEKEHGSLDLFKDYLISRRVLDYDANNIKHGFDSAYSAEYVKNNKSKYEKYAKRWDEFNDRMLGYLEESGIYSKEQIAKIKEKSKDYVSFKRIFEADEVVSGGRGKKGIKKRTGSERLIQDPFLSMIENIEMYVKAVEENRAFRAIVETAETLDQDLITKSKSSMQATDITKEVRDILKENGIEDVDADTYMIFRPREKRLLKNEIEVFRNGKREVWSINDDLLAESLRSVDFSAKTLNPVMQIFAAITRIKKLGISATPEFQIRNVMRDYITSGVFTESEGVSLVDTITAIGDIIKKNDDYYRWLKSGGANGAFMEMGERYLKNDIYKSTEMLNMRDKVMNVVTKPVQWIEFAGNLAEQSTRLAEFKRVSDGAMFGENLLKGGFASREVSLDFQRVGLRMQAFNMMVAFLNPTIQGMDKTARAIKADPKKFTKRAFATVTSISVLTWFANKDDERVKELPQWQKDFFWIFPTDDWQEATPQDNPYLLPQYLVKTENGKMYINKGIIYRFPKPADIGLIFGSIPERILSAYYDPTALYAKYKAGLITKEQYELEKENMDNRSASFQLKDTLTETIMPNIMPDAIAPVMEQMTNKSFFSGSPLVPFNLEKALPEYQYKEYTSDTAILLGKVVGNIPFIKDIGPSNTKLSSPIVIENYIRNWTGTMGSYALQLSDQALRASGFKKTETYPSSTLADIPVIRAFVARHPSMSADSIQRFNDYYKRHEKYQASFKLLMKRQQPEEAAAFMNEHGSKMIKLDAFRQAVSKQNDFIYNVFYNKDYTADEKRQLIDSAYYQMVEIAKAGLEVAGQLDEITEKLKEQGIEQ